MPATFLVDRETRIVRITLTGTVTTAESLAIIDRAAAEAGGPGFDVYSDHVGLDAPATPEQVHAIVAHLGTHAAVFGGARWAVVVRRAVSFGMMRMLGAYAAKIPLYVNVFTDPAEADAWLRQDRAARALSGEG